MPKTCISEKTSRSGRISHFVIPAGLLGRNPVFSLSSLINEQFLRRRWTRLKNPAGVTVIEISRPAKNCRLWCLWSESIRATARKPRPYIIVSQFFRAGGGAQRCMPSRRARFERNSVSLPAAPCTCVKKTARTLCQNFSAGPLQAASIKCRFSDYFIEHFSRYFIGFDLVRSAVQLVHDLLNLVGADIP